ncbi:MAG: HAD family hydrolase [Ruminococcus flavefaciens]|nr:HAD family hydrolase [Ruminococcus flavefaciens]MCM1229499.1 HAD family hydrolase [Ruminococcus flavefaciens]
MDIAKTIILSDMDGTLLNSEKQINEADLKAIEKFTSLGGKFTVATGRTIQTFARYQRLLNLQMPVIMYNGAMIYDYSAEKVLYSQSLPDISRELTAEVMGFMAECGGEVLRTDGTYVFSNNEYEQLHTNLCGIEPEYMDIGEIPQGDWLKVLFALSPERIALLEDNISRLGYYEYADFVRSADIFLEMLPKGISKGSALEEYRKLDGMADFTFAAIGDFDNDIEMIANADIGACPANAEESVKNISDIVLENTNDGGAVAELIDYIINKAGGMGR